LKVPFFNSVMCSGSFEERAAWVSAGCLGS